jgi:hypothetical protein
MNPLWVLFAWTIWHLARHDLPPPGTRRSKCEGLQTGVVGQPVSRAKKGPGDAQEGPEGPSA